MKCDTQTLAAVVEKCFDLSMDLQLSAEARRQYLTAGKRLRGSLVNLLSARFAHDDARLLQANQALQDVNQQLSASVETIAQAQTTLDNVNALVGKLDDLLRIALSFV